MTISKRNFDQKVTLKEFFKDHYVLLWNKAEENPSMNNKFEALWIGPYQIEKIISFNSYSLETWMEMFSSFL